MWQGGAGGGDVNSLVSPSAAQLCFPGRKNVKYGQGVHAQTPCLCWWSKRGGHRWLSVSTAWLYWCLHVLGITSGADSWCAHQLTSLKPDRCEYKRGQEGRRWLSVLLHWNATHRRPCGTVTASSPLLCKNDIQIRLVAKLFLLLQGTCVHT